MGSSSLQTDLGTAARTFSLTSPAFCPPRTLPSHLNHIEAQCGRVGPSGLTFVVLRVPVIHSLFPTICPILAHLPAPNPGHALPFLSTHSFLRALSLSPNSSIKSSQRPSFYYFLNYQLPVTLLPLLPCTFVIISPNGNWSSHVNQELSPGIILYVLHLCILHGAAGPGNLWQVCRYSEHLPIHAAVSALGDTCVPWGGKQTS